MTIERANLLRDMTRKFEKSFGMLGPSGVQDFNRERYVCLVHAGLENMGFPVAALHGARIESVHCRDQIQ